MESLQTNHFANKRLTPALKDKLYSDIFTFRKTFNLPVELGEISVSSDDLHSSLAIEELVELADAKDIVEIADALIDTAYVAVGRVVELGKWIPAIDYLLELILAITEVKGIDFEKVWDEIHSSNLSKTAKNLAEVDANVDHYAKLGVELDIEEIDGLFLLKNAKECFYNGSDVKVGKVMKSIYYKKADIGFVADSAK